MSRDYSRALGIVDALLSPVDPPTFESDRARAADLRHVRGVLYAGQECRRVVDALAPLCPCNTGPDTDGPQQDCPVHGDGTTFVAYVRWLGSVADTARQVLDLLDQAPGSPTATGCAQILRPVLQVGESYREYGDRLYGMYRALLVDVERLREPRDIEVQCPECDTYHEITVEATS